MKSHHRVIAAIVVAVAISLPSLALAAQPPRERGGEKGPVVRIVQKIRKFFGITTHDDLPVPPFPANSPK
jgi:hypothetical protein